MVPGCTQSTILWDVDIDIDCCKAQIDDPILPIEEEPEATRYSYQFINIVHQQNVHFLQGHSYHYVLSLDLLRQNRRKTGELFVNLLDLRGLRVAKDAETGEDIWYLVGSLVDSSEIHGWKHGGEGFQNYYATTCFFSWVWELEFNDICGRCGKTVRCDVDSLVFDGPLGS